MEAFDSFSDASSSSSRSPSPAPTHAATGSTSSISKAPSKPSNTRTSVHYVPPPRYLASQFRTSSSSDLTSDALRNAARGSKELWTIRLPEGVHPSRLDGLTFTLPRDAVAGEPLAAIQGSVASGSGSKGDRYHLFSTAANKVTSTLNEDARNATAGLDKSRARRAGERSGLVGAEEMVDSAPDEAAKGFGTHMAGLRAYVPSGSAGKDGGNTLVAAPLPITQHLEFILVPPTADQSGSTTKVTEAVDVDSTRNSGTPSRKLRKLNGYFNPSGSLYDSDIASRTTPLAATSIAAAAAANAQSSPRKTKGSKSTAEEEAAAAAGASGVNKGKNKKEEKREKREKRKSDADGGDVERKQDGEGGEEGLEGKKDKDKEKRKKRKKD